MSGYATAMLAFTGLWCILGVAALAYIAGVIAWDWLGLPSLRAAPISARADLHASPRRLHDHTNLLPGWR